jgi:hypothetical protein
MNWCVLLMKVVDGLRCVLLMNWCVLLMRSRWLGSSMA